MNTFVQHSSVPDCRHEGGRAAQFRHAVFRRVARPDQGADGRLGRRIPTGDIICCRCSTCGRTCSHRRVGARRARRRAISSSRRPAGAEPFRRDLRESTRRRPMSGSSAAPRPTVRRITMRFTKFRPVTRSRRCRSGASQPKPVDGEDRSERRHEDAAEDSGRYHAGRQILRLCGRTSQAAPAPHHRPADHRADEADRHRAGQELRHRQGRSRREEGAGRRAEGRAETDGMESADARPGRERLVDEHRHDGRLRQLLPEARHRRTARPRREPAARMRSIRSTSATKPASRSTARTSTRSTSTRARRRR